MGTYFLSDLETGQTPHITELILRLKTWQTGSEVVKLLKQI